MLKEIQVQNPRTGQTDYQIMALSDSEIEDRCRTLRLAQSDWSASPLTFRIEVMRRWADEIIKNKDTITKALAVDTGRWRLAAEAPENVAGAIQGWCEMAPQILQPDQGRSSFNPNIHFSQQYVAYALLGVISPWNMPFLLSAIDAVPALLAGCAAIIKPSEITPRFIEPVRETIARVPELDAVLSYVTGDGETGAAIIEHVDFLCFTGSVPTGRKVGMAAAGNFIPAFLELGGKDPVIVTRDADIDRAVTAIIRGAVWATGQLCFSIERIYVDEAIHDAFVARLVEKSEQLELSYPEMRKGDVGPFIFGKQAAIIAEQIEDALAKGANLRTGGEVLTLNGGKWLRPTVLTDVTHNMKVMVEETFGPVMPVMAFSSLDEAIRLANDTRFGLSAAVIAGGQEEAEAIAAQLNAGAVSVMDTTLTNAILRDAEKTAFNCSGLGGSRIGKAALLRFLRKKAIITNNAEPVDIKVLAEDIAPTRSF